MPDSNSLPTDLPIDSAPKGPNQGVVAASAIGLILLALGASNVMMKFRTAPPTAPPESAVAVVEALNVSLGDHSVTVKAQGALQPVTESRLAAEVPGRIIEVSPSFIVGGEMQEGQLILRIDPADYQSVLANAEAQLAEAKLLLETEKARADQAKRDWSRLASSEEKPGALVQRLPQLAAAEAKAKAAEAAVIKAKRDLDRTEVRAPYRGKIKTKRADLGDYTTPGSPLAELWRSDHFEIRLPVSLDELSMLDLDQKPTVTLQSQSNEWKTQITRTEGIVDRSTRTMTLFAELKSPQLTPSPGQFFAAKIAGKTLKQVAAVPRKAFISPTQVLTIDKSSKIRFSEVTTVWGDEANLYVSKGLTTGDQVCLTALATPIDGMPIKLLSPQTKP